MDIKKMLIAYNYTKGRSGNVIKYIVVHDTDNASTGANAQMHYRYFNEPDRGASANYFVDDTQIIQTVDDTNTAWHCGDGNGAYGITNANSIGVEICINKDGDYDKAVSNGVGLVRYLMDKYGIDTGCVVRHYDASRKNCPGSMSANNWAKWREFKSRLTYTTYKDQSKISSWALEAVKKSQEYGIMIGDDKGNFNPKKAVTREEAACMMSNLLKKIGM